MAATLLLLNFEASHAAEAIDYAEGITGRLYRWSAPLTGDQAKDRQLRLKVRLEVEPEGFPSAYDDAARSVCQRNKAKLVENAQAIAPAEDWRLRVTFDWQVSRTNSVTVTEGETVELWLASYSRV